MTEKKLDESNGILLVRTTGSIDIKEMFEGVDYLDKSVSLPRNLKILENAEGASVTFKIEDIPTIIGKLEKILDIYGYIRHAVIHTDPTSTAYTVIAKGMIRRPNYSLEVFSTKDAALNWLSLFA
jgi:hypothetical protein